MWEVKGCLPQELWLFFFSCLLVSSGSGGRREDKRDLHSHSDYAKWQLHDLTAISELQFSHWWTEYMVKVKVSCVWLFATPGLYSPWNSPGQNTGVGSLSLLQGIFPTQGLNLGLLHCRYIPYHLIHQGSPATLVTLCNNAARYRGTGGVVFWQYGTGCWSGAPG